MSTLSIRISDSLHRAVRELADSDRISINQFISYALTEKVSALKTVDYLRQRAKNANLDDFDKLLAMVPNVEPEEFDRLPSETKKVI